MDDSPIAPLARVGLGLALVGTALSAFVHVAALLGESHPLGGHERILAYGAIASYALASLCVRRMMGDARLGEIGRAGLRGCPSWLKRALIALALYSLAIVALSPESAASSLRVSSAVGLVLFALCAAAFLAFTRVGVLAARVCSNGHRVSPFASFCEICGARVE